MENKGDSSTTPTNKSLPSVLANPHPSAVPQNTNDLPQGGEVVSKNMNEGKNPSIDDEKKKMEKEGAVAVAVAVAEEKKEEDAAAEVKKDGVMASGAAEAHDDDVIVNNYNLVRYVNDYDLNQLPPEAAEFEDYY